MGLRLIRCRLFTPAALRDTVREAIDDAANKDESQEDDSDGEN